MVSHCKWKISRLVAVSDWKTGSTGGILAVRLWKKKSSNNNNNSCHKTCCITAAARGQRIIPARIQRSTDTCRDGWEISEDRLRKVTATHRWRNRNQDVDRVSKLTELQLHSCRVSVWPRFQPTCEEENCCHTNIVFPLLLWSTVLN